MEDIMKIQEEYVQLAIAHGTALTTGDYKTANKAYSKLTRLYNKIIAEPQNAENILGLFLQHSNYLVRGWAAAHALGLGVHTNKAQEVLKELSERKDIGIIRLESETTLEEWQRKGTLKF